MRASHSNSRLVDSVLKPRAGLALLFTAWVGLAAATNGLAAIHCVDQNGANPTPPYTNWATAATNIQDAVDAAAAGDEVVVTNGTYATGGRTAGTNLLSNRVMIDKTLTLRSITARSSRLFLAIRCPQTSSRTEPCAAPISPTGQF